MDLQTKVVQMLAVIIGALAVGYLARKLRWLPGERSRDISRFAMTWVQSMLIALLIWGLDAPSWRTALLPVILAVLIALNWPIGVLGARLMGLRRHAAASFVLACMFSNMGLSYGAFVCYMLLGEQGAALGMIWVMSFLPMYYTLGFIVARRYGHEGPQTLGETIRETLRSPESRNPLIGFAVGGALYALGPARPEAVVQAVEVLVPSSTAIFLFAIGLSMRLTSVVTYWRECVAVGAAKFVVTPLLGLGLAWLVLVLAQLFDLDEHLANAAWLTTNVAAAALAPLVLKIAAGL